MTAGRYEALVHALDAGVRFTAVACPKLVPLIEAGEQTVDAVREYAAPLQEAGCDTVILGCTHYPLIRPVLQRVFGRDVTLVFSAEETAREVAATLAARGWEHDRAREGEYGFLTTGDPELFRELGERFLQLPLGDVRRVSVAELERGGRMSRGTTARRPDQLRPVVADPAFLEQPHGMVLWSQGKTRVLCTASIEERVPRWLHRSGRGWVTAEYSLLPASTGERTEREAARGKQGGRTVEIQRLIGRARARRWSTSRRSASARSTSTATCCRPTAARAARRSAAPTSPRAARSSASASRRC